MRWHKMPFKNFIGRGILLVLLLYSLFPIYMAVSASLKTRTEIFLNPFGLPQRLYFENYTKAYEVGHLGQAFRNSGILSAGTALGVLLTAAPAAFALAKIRFPGDALLVAYMFFCTTIPSQLFIIPLFHIFARMGFINSIIGLIVIYIARSSPFVILLLRSFFVKIPNELIEAALVDGASRWQAFWKIVFPVAKPGIVTAAVIVAMGSWNEFLLPLTFINKRELEPVTVALATFRGKWSAEWEMIMASCILGALPIVLLFAILHRRFIAGLAETGLKG